MSIPDWLSWNQNSVFESQSEIDTWQGGICKSCRLLRSRPAAGGGPKRFLRGRGFLRRGPRKTEEVSGELRETF